MDQHSSVGHQSLSPLLIGDPGNDPSHIIVHCSASDYGDRTVIDMWHRHRGWAGIGYHYVILNGFRRPRLYTASADGLVEPGRRVDRIGAHCKGYNDRSIGVCWIGSAKHGGPSPLQMVTLIRGVSNLAETFSIPIEHILGHRETGAKKTCPDLHMGSFRDAIARIRDVW